MATTKDLTNLALRYFWETGPWSWRKRVGLLGDTLTRLGVPVAQVNWRISEYG